MFKRVFWGFFFGVTLIMALISSGCTKKAATALQPDATVKTPPVSEQAASSTPAQAVADTPTPSATSSPAAATNPPLQSDKIPPDAEAFILKYSFEDVAPYNVFFTDRSTADMDGDGSIEEIVLTPVKTENEGEYEYYRSLRVSLGNDELTIEADPGYALGEAGSAVGGTILDLDKNDGNKELVIEEQSDGEASRGPQTRYILITFPNSKPKVLTKLDYYVEATGTGFVTGIKYTKPLKGGYSIAIQTILRYLPESGFEEVKSDSYKAVSYTSFAPESSEGYPTSWNQRVAHEPGGKPSVTIKKNTEIFFGLFSPKGWIELHDAEGATLGWLDLNNVDIDKYIGYALQAACH